MFKQAHSSVRKTTGLFRRGRVVLTVLLPVVAGGIGYYAGAMREPAVTHLSGNATVALNQLVAADSFSEVAQARAVLGALADRYVEYAQMMITRDRTNLPVTHESHDPAGRRSRLAAIQVLEEAVAEFEGTGEELQLLPTLLHALKRAELHDRWLDVYLKALYEHPTHKLIGRLAAEAVLIGQTTCREAEVTAALRHVTAIPLEFESKAPIERCLIYRGAGFQTARHVHEPAIVAPRS